MPRRRGDPDDHRTANFDHPRRVLIPSQSRRVTFLLNRWTDIFLNYDDGFGIIRDAQTAKPQTFRTGDGWFAYNLAVNLSQQQG